MHNICTYMAISPLGFNSISFLYRLISISKGTNNKWTCNLIDHLMLDLKTIIALAFMICIANLDAYELHQRDEKIFKGLLFMNARVLH